MAENMKLPELGFLNPNRSSSAHISSNMNARITSNPPSFAQTNGAADADSFEKKDDEKNAMKRSVRKLVTYAVSGAAATAAWIYMLIQRKKIEELTAQVLKQTEKAVR